MASEEQLQKFNTDDVSVPRSGWYIWLVMPQEKFIFLYLSLPILCRVTATARGTNYCRPAVTVPPPMQWERSPHWGSSTLYQQCMGSLMSHRIYMCKSLKTGPMVYHAYPRRIKSNRLQMFLERRHFLLRPSPSVKLFMYWTLNPFN